MNLNKNPATARFGVSLPENPSSISSGFGVSPIGKTPEFMKFKGFGLPKNPQFDTENVETNVAKQIERGKNDVLSDGEMT